MTGRRRYSHPAMPVNENDLEKDLPDRYRVLAVLGRGGFGVVFHARDKLLARDIAIKVLHEPAPSPRLLARFQREAKATARLSHPGIVSILDFGVSPSQHLYMVMEYVEGLTLKELLKQNGTLELDAGIELFRRLCQAMAHAHKNGVMHRDLKPANVIMASPIPKIVDFGIARLKDGSAAGELTGGSAIGSPLYMSPEQGRGCPVDERSDIYSMGVLIFETLTGALPHRGASAADTILLRETTPAPRLGDLLHNCPYAIENLVDDCLQRDPDKRPESFGEILHILDRVAEGDENTPGIHSLEENYASEQVRSYQPTSKILTIALCCVTGIGIFVLVSGLQEENHASNREASGDSRLQNAIENRDSIIRDVHGKFVCERADDADLLNLSQQKDMRELSLEYPAFENGERAYSILLNAPNLKTLSIRSAKSVDKDSLEVISRLPVLKELQLRQCKGITVEGLKHLSRAPSLSKVVLHCEGIDDQAIPVLMACKNLSSLSLNETDVTSKGLAKLDRYRHFDHLGLADLNLRDEDLIGLSELEITSLDLSGNHLSPPSVEALIKKTALRKLGLRDLGWKEKQRLALSRNCPGTVMFFQAGVTLLSGKQHR